ncbi:SMI1/KNR4 family protein [Undibacterium sp. Ji83W]|uniref:SMI1/KNR4 family protein n=1 Tax=Undibacterium sp. Ji83W TaxID=3413043 RepID=UPI003BF0C650
MIDWDSFGTEKKSSVDTRIVSVVQEKLNVIFPQSYVDLVMYCDCACPEISTFEYQEEETCISEFFEFTDEVRQFTISWYARPHGVFNLPERFIPIARDAGAYLICLNFDKSSPTVDIFDPASGQSLFVARSFSEFVSCWHE